MGEGDNYTNVSPPYRGSAVFAPLPSSGPKWWGNFPKGTELASSLVVSLGKALNVITSTFEWLDW